MPVKTFQPSESFGNLNLTMTLTPYCIELQHYIQAVNNQADCLQPGYNVEFEYFTGAIRLHD